MWRELRIMQKTKIFKKTAELFNVFPGRGVGWVMPFPPDIKGAYDLQVTTPYLL